MKARRLRLLLPSEMALYSASQPAKSYFPNLMKAGATCILLPETETFLFTVVLLHLGTCSKLSLTCQVSREGNRSLEETGKESQANDLILQSLCLYQVRAPEHLVLQDYLTLPLFWVFYNIFSLFQLL